MTPEEEQAHQGPVTEGKVLEPYKAPPVEIHPDITIETPEQQNAARASQPEAVRPADEGPARRAAEAAPSQKAEAPAQEKADDGLAAQVKSKNEVFVSSVGDNPEDQEIFEEIQRKNNRPDAASAPAAEAAAEQPKPPAERSPGQAALDALNEFTNAAAKFGIESPEAEAARAAYQKAEWARQDAMKQARGENSEVARAERPWVAENSKLQSDIERARAALARARGTERTMLSGALAKQELSDLLRQRIAELERIRQEATEKGLPINRYAAEGNLDAARAELRALETPPGWMGPLQQRVRESFDVAKGKAGSWWESFKGAASGVKEKVSAAFERTRIARGFIWERIKGIGGFREALQFEKVRSGTKELGKNLERDASKLWTEQQLREQERIMLDARGYESMDAEEKKQLVREIRENFIVPMRRRNELRINEMVDTSLAIFKEKMAKVTHAMTGESAVSPERLAIVEATIRQRLQERAASRTGQHMADYTRELRRLADPHWKARLGFAGIQAVLAGLGIGYIGSKLIEGTLLSGKSGAGIGQGGKIGGGGASSSFEAPGIIGPSPTGLEQIPLPPGVLETSKPAFIEMHKNIWTTLAQKAAENGLTLPDSQLIELSKQVIADNKLYEVVWPDTGITTASTRKLMEGFILKMNPAVMKALGMTVF
jgi:hypothetical protein